MNFVDVGRIIFRYFASYKILSWFVGYLWYFRTPKTSKTFCSSVQRENFGTQCILDGHARKARRSWTCKIEHCSYIWSFHRKSMFFPFCLVEHVYTKYVSFSRPSKHEIMLKTFLYKTQAVLSCSNEQQMRICWNQTEIHTQSLRQHSFCHILPLIANKGQIDVVSVRVRQQSSSALLRRTVSWSHRSKITTKSLTKQCALYTYFLFCKQVVFHSWIFLELSSRLASSSRTNMGCGGHK